MHKKIKIKTFRTPKSNKSNSTMTHVQIHQKENKRTMVLTINVITKKISKGCSLCRIEKSLQFKIKVLP